jgi:hypothetical protein
MGGSTGIPRTVSQVLSPLKRHLRCAQGQHVLVCCWVLLALIRDPGQGPRKGLRPSRSSTLKYWTTLRMVRSGPREAPVVLTHIATATLRALPPPPEGVLSLMGDSTLKPTRGRQPPVGHGTRPSEQDASLFGCALVLVSMRWEHVRVPIGLGLIDPAIRGPQNSVFRPRLRDFVPPAWGRQLIVVVDAGSAANATLRLMTERRYAYVFAMPQTRKLTPGNHRHALVQHLPKTCDHHRASHKPDGRRRDSWGFLRRAPLHNLGDVTIVLSKKRRTDGLKGVKILVTNLTEAAQEPFSVSTRGGEVSRSP